MDAYASEVGRQKGRNQPLTRYPTSIQLRSARQRRVEPGQVTRRPVLSRPALLKLQSVVLSTGPCNALPLESTPFRLPLPQLGWGSRPRSDYASHYTATLSALLLLSHRFNNKAIFKWERYLMRRGSGDLQHWTRNSLSCQC